MRVLTPLPPPRATQHVLARVVRRILDCAASSGMDRPKLVEAAGLSGVDLADGDARVAMSSLVAVWQIVSKTHNDPGLAIEWAKSMSVPDWGLLGYLLVHSNTVEDALRRFERYFRIVAASADARLVKVDRHGVALVIRSASGLDVPYAVDYLLASIVATVRFISGVDVAPREVACSYAQPSSILPHLAFYRCTIRFSQPDSRIVFRDTDLALRIRKGDADLVNYLAHYADTVLHSLSVSGSFLERVRSAIWEHLPEGRPSVQRIAATIGVPARTLQRRLAAENTSVQAEVEEIRRRVALVAVRDRAHSIEEVAFFLGYTEPSTFFRQFKRWTGTTPSRFRQAAA